MYRASSQYCRASGEVSRVFDMLDEEEFSIGGNRFGPDLTTLKIFERQTTLQTNH